MAENDGRGGSRITRLTGADGEPHSGTVSRESRHALGGDSLAELKVVGIGGGGSNAVDRMIEEHVQGVEFIAVNTDAQALVRSSAPTRIRVGDKATRGLGSGGQPSLGQKAAEESLDEIREAVEGADMVFIAAGMGGGTGTGGAPVVADVARETGALTVGVVTRPFDFEGSTRSRYAEEGIRNLQERVDTLVMIPNQQLLAVADPKMSVTEAFALADDVLRQGIQGVSDLITQPGLINLDFNDVRAVMTESGTALMAIGEAQGEDRATDAIHQALNSPLLNVSVDGARGVLLNFTGGPDMTLHEVNEAADIVAKAAEPNANIIFGTVIDEAMEGRLQVTVIATGFQTGAEEARPTRRRGSRPSSSPMVRELDFSSRSRESSEMEIPAFLRRRSEGR
ncbi:MAG: cell division protein FtsZ [Chloroflexota bacterium]|nr:cell division protein FtsZ [Chloroflexota bacterium]